jgi:hypothetical protein
MSKAPAQALNVLDNDVSLTANLGGCVFGIAAAVAILRAHACRTGWTGWQS